MRDFDKDFEKYFNSIDKDDMLEKHIDKIQDEELLEEMEQVASKYARGEYDEVPAPVNRTGKCPSCQEDWEGEEIIDVISKLDVFLLKPKEAAAFAEKYGWTKENKKKFSKAIGVEFTTQGNHQFVQCPKCRHVFNILTGQHYLSLNEARNSLYE